MPGQGQPARGGVPSSAARIPGGGSIGRKGGRIPRGGCYRGAMVRRCLRRFLAGAWLAATICAAPTTLLVGEGCLACTSDVCGSRLVFTVKEPQTAALAPGVWEFELVLDGGAPLEASCEIGMDSRSASCEPADITVSPMIVGDPDDPFTRFQIDIDGGIDSGTDELPAVVDLTIVHDGDVVVDDRIEPDYELSKPKRCDDDCFSDFVEIVVQR